MTFKIGPDVLSNNEIELRENSNGNLEVVSKGNGEILTVDESASLSDKIESTLSDNLDANGNDLNNVGTANANSVNTASLTDTEDGEAWETLREAGFEKGDIVNQSVLQGTQKSASTNSNSFSQTFGAIDRVVPPYFGYPEDTTIMCRLTTNARSDSDTLSGSVRVSGLGAGVILPTQTFTSSGKIKIDSGWVPVENIPTTTDRILLELKSEGSNDIFVESPSFLLGVQL